MMKFKHLSIGFLIQIIILIPQMILGQVADFSCDPNFKFYRHVGADEEINSIYDSLNQIDFSEVDFELRIWEYGLGQSHITQNVFIMRHFAKSDKWKAYYHVGNKGHNTHKSFKEYFSNARLKRFQQKEWKALWDSLKIHNILTLNSPSRNSLSEKLGGPGHWITVSHDTYYHIELIKKDCKRGYGFSHAFINMEVFKEVEEFKEFRAILSLMNEKVESKRSNQW